MSPVVASMYCSPHSAALHIDPPPGSGVLLLGFGAWRTVHKKRIRSIGAENSPVRMFDSTACETKTDPRQLQTPTRQPTAQEEAQLLAGPSVAPAGLWGCW